MQSVINNVVAECEGRIKRPGKFEGENRYIPYFWQKGLEGGSDMDGDETEDDNSMGFVVTAEDVALFPELEVGQEVWLYERTDGFVCEL